MEKALMPAQVSSTVGWICSGGKRKPSSPVSLSSMVYTNWISGTPLAQSLEVPEEASEIFQAFVY